MPDGAISGNVPYKAPQETSIGEACKANRALVSMKIQRGAIDQSKRGSWHWY